jgi:hypothetical protein
MGGHLALEEGMRYLRNLACVVMVCAAAFAWRARTYADFCEQNQDGAWVCDWPVDCTAEQAANFCDDVDCWCGTFFAGHSHTLDCDPAAQHAGDCDGGCSGFMAN